MKCQRCQSQTVVHTMSYFNTDLICIPCASNERLHPSFAKAKEAELAAVRSGNLNFAGLGKPDDL
jgi:hypothetical protein